MDIVIKILDLIIKTFVVTGLFVALFLFFKILYLNYKIEKKYKDIEENKNFILVDMTHNILRIKDEILSLERKRENLIRIIPFIK